MMKLKGVLFDFDGVIIKSMEQHLVAWQHTYRKYGVEIEPVEFLKLEGRGVAGVVDDLSQKYSVPQQLAEKIMQDKIKYYDSHLQVEFYEGFFELLDFLKSNNIAMVIVTGGSRDRIESFSDKYLNGYFKGIVTSDDVENTKPSPEPYLKGLEILDLPAGECLVIENAPLGIESAKSAGLCVIAIQTTLGREYLSGADYIVNTFAEVKGILKNWLSL